MIFNISELTKANKAIYTFLKILILLHSNRYDRNKISI
jgi:hypothetical protein